MSIEFRLPQQRTAFGILTYPRIEVAVETVDGDVVVRFLVDTGADFALAPRGLAEAVGLEWSRLPEVGVRGVGGRGQETRLGRLPIRLGATTMTVRCMFMDSARTPLILGRADVLDRFILTLDQPARRLVLTEVT